MPTCYIRATKDNLKEGHIIIRITNKGIPYGPFMVCTSLDSCIETGIINCSIHAKDGFLKTKKIPISELARVHDHYNY